MRHLFGFAILVAALATAMGNAAYAWNPNTDPDPSAVAPTSSGNLPNYVVPQRYYTPTYNPAAVPVAPTVSAAPAYTPQPSAPVAYAPAAAAPADAYPVNNSAPEATGGLVRNRYSVGVEAFYDNYEEPDTFPDLHIDSYYGALTGSMTHYFNRQLFGTAEGRISYGESDYYSDQGHTGDTPQWETEVRLLAGYDAALSDNDHLKPYAGFGTRYYFDNAKGDISQTSNGIALGYDRRILQYYVPIGVTYDHVTPTGLTWSPTIEVDPLLFGVVRSRIAETGLSNSNSINDQHDGMGYRAQLMVSQRDAQGRGFEFGPFVRYWDIKDSDSSPEGFEPHNNRFQFGTDLKYMF